jgi:hypothetical protein
MAEIKSLKDQILERLNMKKGGPGVASANIRKASHDFEKSDAPQFRGKSKKKRHQMAVAAGLGAARGESALPKTGDKAIYEDKKCVIRSITESGMATIRFGNNRELIVRASALKADKPEPLTEGVLGIGMISPTYREPSNYGFVKLEGLDPEDIGLIFEDDDTGEKDEQEEDHDNGSNIRHDGHTLKKEVDELPTPSDTIAPAYSDDKPPKEISEPLSTHVGAQEEHLWDEPEWDGYDYPADAPEIPTADFHGSEMGNSRAPHFNDSEHQAGTKGKDYHEDDEGSDNKKTAESYYRRTGKDTFSFVAEDGGDPALNPGATHDNYMDTYGNGGNIIPSPRGMSSAIDHDQVYGNLNTARSGNGPTDIPRGTVNNYPNPTLQRSGGFNSLRNAVPATSTTMMPGNKAVGWQAPKPGNTAPFQPVGPNVVRPDASKPYSGLGSMNKVAEGDVTDPSRKKGSKDLAKMRKDIEFNENFFMSEMDDMLGPGEDTEPKSGDTITVTLPAMASILCTVANKVGGDRNMLKAIVEALAEVSKGKTIDIDDLDAVAAHINGEELPEIENREEGNPDHEGIDGMNPEAEDHDDDESWPGDGEPTKSGKTKLMGGVGESVMEFYGGYDVLADTRMTEEEELQLVRRRAFPNGVRRGY